MFFVPWFISVQKVQLKYVSSHETTIRIVQMFPIYQEIQCSAVTLLVECFGWGGSFCQKICSLKFFKVELLFSQHFNLKCSNIHIYLFKMSSGQSQSTLVNFLKTFESLLSLLCFLRTCQTSSGIWKPSLKEKTQHRMFSYKETVHVEEMIVFRKFDKEITLFCLNLVL